MFSIKSAFDGTIEELLEFPIAVIRTHYCILSNGPCGPSILQLRLAHEARGYLRLGTTAFIDLLLIYAVVQALNMHADSFENNLIISVFKLSKFDPATKEFVTFLSYFLIVYYAFYAVAWIGGLKGTRRSTVVGACLFYSVLSLFAAFVLWLVFRTIGVEWAHFIDNRYFSTPLYRSVLVVIYAVLFWQIGAIFASRLRARRFKINLWLIDSVAGFLGFAVYLGAVALTLGVQEIWPRLDA